jgi:hypothetical protein
MGLSHVLVVQTRNIWTRRAQELMNTETQPVTGESRKVRSCHL